MLLLVVFLVFSLVGLSVLLLVARAIIRSISHTAIVLILMTDYRRLRSIGCQNAQNVSQGIVKGLRKTEKVYKFMCALTITHLSRPAALCFDAVDINPQSVWPLDFARCSGIC